MNILLISYFYPPLGGPAALRNQKTVKYLSELGCVIDVISVGEIEYNTRDESLVSQTKERTLIRTASLDPMAILKKLSGKKPGFSENLYRGTPEWIKLLIRRLYPLDDKVGWLPQLVTAGTKAMQSNRYDLIYVSCGPFSSSLAAWWLGRKFGVPYVVEMRDYWTLLSDYNLQGSLLNRSFARAWEKRVLHDASGIVTATRGIGEDLAKAFGSRLTSKLITMFNGHDEEDYLELPDVSGGGKSFTLCYFGSLYARRSLKNLYRAFLELAQAGRLPENARIKLYGNYNREALQELEQSGIKDRVDVVSQLSHKEALQQMQASDVLILVINSSSPKGTLTSKVFEYLRLGKPILAMIPAHGEAAELLEESGQDYICAMESVSSIKVSLQWLINDREINRQFHYPAVKYSRKEQVTALYDYLKRIKP
jgi:glycosyltransferase involved in cell wall biosynthesis